MSANLVGERFNWQHAAGVTRFQVDRPHRDAGYFECVAVRGVSGAHHFIGSIQVFSRQEIERVLISDAMAVLHRNRACYRCGAAPEHCDCPGQMEPDGAR